MRHIVWGAMTRHNTFMNRTWYLVCHTITSLSPSPFGCVNNVISLRCNSIASETHAKMYVLSSTVVMYHPAMSIASEHQILTTCLFLPDHPAEHHWLGYPTYIRRDTASPQDWPLAPHWVQLQQQQQQWVLRRYDQGCIRWICTSIQIWHPHVPLQWSLPLASCQPVRCISCWWWCRQCDERDTVPLTIFHFWKGGIKLSILGHAMNTSIYHPTYNSWLQCRPPLHQ